MNLGTALRDTLRDFGYGGYIVGIRGDADEISIARLVIGSDGKTIAAAESDDGEFVPAVVWEAIPLDTKVAMA